MKAGDVDHFLSRRARNIAVDAGDLPVQHGDIHRPVDLVRRIDDVSSLENQVISRSILRQGGGGGQGSGHELSSLQGPSLTDACARTSN